MNAERTLIYATADAVLALLSDVISLPVTHDRLHAALKAARTGNGDAANDTAAVAGIAKVLALNSDLIRERDAACTEAAKLKASLDGWQTTHRIVTESAARLRTTVEDLRGQLVAAREGMVPANRGDGSAAAEKLAQAVQCAHEGREFRRGELCVSAVRMDNLYQALLAYRADAPRRVATAELTSAATSALPAALRDRLARMLVGRECARSFTEEEGAVVNELIVWALKMPDAEIVPDASSAADTQRERRLLGGWLDAFMIDEKYGTVSVRDLDFLKQMAVNTRDLLASAR